MTRYHIPVLVEKFDGAAVRLAAVEITETLLPLGDHITDLKRNHVGHQTQAHTETLSQY